MKEGPRHQHLHQEWQEPLEERGGTLPRLLALRMARSTLDQHLSYVVYVIAASCAFACITPPSFHSLKRKSKSRVI